jgi:DNA-binding NarL/FixJ family response regulator
VRDLLPVRNGRESSRTASAPAAREALRRAVIAREAALAACRAADASCLWVDLIEGRWTILDAFTASGARYVIAHENSPDARDSRALSPRERIVLSQVLAGVSSKRIALEMQISQPTVSRVLRSALGHLGAADLCTLAGIRTALFEPLDRLDSGAFAYARIEGVTRSLARLTDAERSILDAIMAGWTMATIAKDRGTSPRTVAHQVESIYRKVGVMSRRELLAMFR